MGHIVAEKGEKGSLIEGDDFLYVARTSLARK